MNQIPQDSETGKLIVNVRTADGSIPVPGAKVSVFTYEGTESTLIAVLVGDDSGSTPPLEIATPDRALSESPGNAKGYTSLVVQVEKEGFTPNQFIGTAVFPGITTIQQVNLIPLPEFATQTEPMTFFESEAADL
ncbi:MAG: hypothetical protein ACI3YK_05900 [Eubacteriales bacterium]